MSWRDKRPLKPFEWGFLVLLLAVLLYVAVSLWGVVAGACPTWAVLWPTGSSGLPWG